MQAEKYFRVCEFLTRVLIRPVEEPKSGRYQTKPAFGVVLQAASGAGCREFVSGVDHRKITGIAYRATDLHRAAKDMPWRFCLIVLCKVLKLRLASRRGKSRAVA